MSEATKVIFIECMTHKVGHTFDTLKLQKSLELQLKKLKITILLFLQKQYFLMTTTHQVKLKQQEHR